MKLKKILCLAVSLLCFAGAICSQEAARQLAYRLLGDRADYFDFRLVRDLDTIAVEGSSWVISYQQDDAFRLSQQEDHLLVEGSSDLAMAMGLNHYLKHYAHVHVSWFDCHPVELPRVWPRLEEDVERSAVVPDRFFLNYCTYGYTMVWWQWEQWERFIDWMALNGINMPLALTGQEAVWQEVWREYGLSDEEIRAYFSGPAHLPWHRMANLDGFGGPLPQQWIDGQKQLQQAILHRERELGMTPILPAFAGHVPRQMAERYPQADIKRLSSWCGFDPTYFLNSTDPLFGDIQQRYLQKQEALFGTDHIYGCDPFNEMDPPSWEPDYLASVSRNIYASMQAVDPQARWLQMTWVFYYKRGQWTPERLKAYLSAVPGDSLLLLDYFCEKTEVWRTTIDSSLSATYLMGDESTLQKQCGFYGQPFIWCYLGNFGGNTMLVGDIHSLDEKLTAALREAENLCGVGSTLEGFDCSPQTYEFLFESVWRPRAEHRGLPECSLGTSFADEWADLRHGSANSYARQAWHLLLDSVYKDWSFYGLGSQVCARPSFEGHGTYYTKPYYSYDNATLLRAVRLLMEQPSSRSSYRYDLVNLLSQYLANQFMEVRNAFTIAYREGDLVRMRQCRDVAMELMGDLDRLLSGEPSADFSQWVLQARAWGGDDKGLQDYYERQARTLISIWGGPVLNDYGNRLWGRLVGQYYAERWRRFFSQAIDKVGRGEQFDPTAFDEGLSAFEQQFAQAVTVSRRTSAGGSVMREVRRILKHIDKGRYDVPDHDREQFEAYMRRYPEASLQDVYKWCFQDVYGPGHLIKDSLSCVNYIEREMAAMGDGAPAWDYEYCGPNGNFVRVNIALVKEGRIPIGLFVETLLESANKTKKMPLYDWKGIWQRYVVKLRGVEPRPLHFDDNLRLLDENLESGNYVFHHSRHFNEVYDMHYRIIRRDLFESKLLQMIERKTY